MRQAHRADANARRATTQQWRADQNAASARQQAYRADRNAAAAKQQAALAEQRRRAAVGAEARSTKLAGERQRALGERETALQEAVAQREASRLRLVHLTVANGSRAVDEG